METEIMKEREGRERRKKHNRKTYGEIANLLIENQ